MNRISVIIPVYNRGETITYCLESVFRQTLQPLEILVVDDCSIDQTVQIVLQYNHPLVRVIQLEKNSGAQAARNRGIQAAKGEWIAFLDSDDEWMPQKLERQLNYALTNNLSVVYTGMEVWINGVAKLHSVQDYSIDSYSKILSSPGPMFQALLAKRSCFEKIDYLDENVPAYQEWDTFIRLAKKNTLGFLNEPLFRYHLHNGATISKDGKKDADGYSYIVHKHKEEIIKVTSIIIYTNHLHVISDKYFRINSFVKWKKINNEILSISDSTRLDRSFKTLIVNLFPLYYHRFSDQITPVFIIKRLFYLLRKSLRTI